MGGKASMVPHTLERGLARRTNFRIGGCHGDTLIIVQYYPIGQFTECVNDGREYGVYLTSDSYCVKKTHKSVTDERMNIL